MTQPELAEPPKETRMTTLNDLAPYPRRVEDVTANSLAAALAVRAHARQSSLDDLLVDSSEAARRLFALTVGTVVADYGVIELLARLGAISVDAADEAAREVWEDWEDGQAVGVGLWQYVAAYGIDPEQVSRVAAGQRAKIAAKAASDG